MFSVFNERGFKLVGFEGFIYSERDKALSGLKLRCSRGYRCSAHMFTYDLSDNLLTTVGVITMKHVLT